MQYKTLLPLDAQTVRLAPDQYPSVRMLLVIAVIATSGLVLSWAAHRDAMQVARNTPAEVTKGAPTAPATVPAIDRQLMARVIPLRP